MSNTAKVIIKKPGKDPYYEESSKIWADFAGRVKFPRATKKLGTGLMMMYTEPGYSNVLMEECCVIDGCRYYGTLMFFRADLVGRPVDIRVTLKDLRKRYPQLWAEEDQLEIR